MSAVAEEFKASRVVRWTPPISEKQMGLLKDRRRYILVTGPRLSTKTVGCLHKLAHHAWEVDRAAITMVPKSVTSVKDEGTWTLLTEHILPAWFAGGFGMHYTQKPKRDVGSGKMVCAVSNRHGTSSHFQIDSLLNEHEVEAKFKNKNFSAIYIPELSNFKSERCFHIWKECLRRPPGYSDDGLLFLGDTNPSEEGEDSWIYKLWFKSLLEMVSEATMAAQADAFKLYQSQLGLWQFSIDDNIWLSDDEKAAKKASYLTSDMYERLWLGLWKRGGTNGVFQDVFRPTHIVGTPDEELYPEENCNHLLTGWDTGSANKAVFVIEPVLLTFPDGVERFAFKVLDEFVELNSRISVADLTEVLEAKMDHWEEIIGKPVLWQHISDTSAFEHYQDIAESYEAKEVFRASEGRIELMRGPVKAKGSVRARVNLLRKLFVENRVFIAGQCGGLIRSLSSLMPGKVLALDMTSPHKHAFDGFSYPVSKTCFGEMQQEIRNMTKKKDVAKVTAIPF